MSAHKIRSIVGQACFIAALAGMASQSYAIWPWRSVEEELLEYGAKINLGDPNVARAFLKESELLREAEKKDPQRTAELVSKARAISDLEELLDKSWESSHDAELSAALALRIDHNKPLSGVGIGPKPETLMVWAARYKNYPPNKNKVLVKAIRRFDVVFGSSGPANLRDVWMNSTIRERNIVLAEKAMDKLNSMIRNQTATDKAYQDMVKDGSLFEYLDADGRARHHKYLEQLAAAESAKAKLKAPQLEQLKGQSIEQQLYILGSMFDKNEVSAIFKSDKKIDSVRPSRPSETIAYQQNQVLSGMLRTALLSEARQSAAGRKVISGQPNVAIESCKGCYAKYDPSGDKIVIDSDLIQQYVRMRDITTETLMADKQQLDMLAKYLAPMFVHEATHKSQHAWADRTGLYKPYTQEDEIEANSMEAVYTLERLQKDPKTIEVFAKMRDTTYAEQRLKLAQRFLRNPANFSENVRQLYYYGLPSFDAASSQVLAAVSAELKRREALPKEELKDLERSGLTTDEAIAMTAKDLAVYVKEIRSNALRKIQADMLDKALYIGHYEETSDWAAKAAKGVKTTATIGAVPAL